MPQQSFDQQIQQAEQRLATLNAKMDGIRAQFTEAVSKVLATEIPRIARDTVAAWPEAAAKLASDGLRNLKQAVSALAGDAGSIARREVHDARIWWHIDNKVKPERESSSTASSYYSVYGNSRPELLDHAVRRGLGTLAAVLRPSGLLDTSKSPYGHPWRGGQPDYSGGSPKYPGSFDWSDEMLALATGYAELVREAEGVHHKLDSLLRQKAEAEVRNLWDSV